MRMRVSVRRSTPPSEDRAPPSNRAWTSRPSTGDRPGKTGVSYDMAGWNFVVWRVDVFGDKFIRHINGLIHARLPNQPVR